MDRDVAIKRIKTALKKRSGKDWSVKGGRGTAWGWIKIDAPPRRKTWDWVQTQTPEPPSPGACYRGAMNVTPGYRVDCGAYDPILSPADDPWAREAAESGRPLVYNWEAEKPCEYGHMSPSDRLELMQLLGLGRAPHYQGVSIAASNGHYEEYVARAEGREVTIFGERYWD